MEIRAAGATDRGQVRPHNEDAFHCGAENGLFIVADGMGGQLAGEIASRMAIDVLRDHIERGAAEGEALHGASDPRHSQAANRLASAVRLANRAIFDAGRSNPAWRNMGTTVVAAQLTGNRLAVAHVGDSRLYLWRGGVLLQLTDDHSLVAEQVRQGLLTAAEADKSTLKNIITRALGESTEVKVDSNEFDLHDGDRLLLCTDGLSNMVDDTTLAAMLAADEDPQLTCTRLIARANAGGGRDNIPAIVIQLAEPGFLSGMRRIFSSGR
jgi:protein phosphatase